MAFEGPLRLRNACDTCHQLKRKCSGTMPCENCALSNLRNLCFYSPTNRLGRPRGSKNRRKMSACSNSGSSQTQAGRQNTTQQRHQQLAAPIITEDSSQLLPRRSPQRQESGKWPGRLDFVSGLAAESESAGGADWDQIDMEMAGIELDGSLTANSSDAQVPMHSPPEPMGHSSCAIGRGCFLDHDLFAALLDHTTASNPVFASVPSHPNPHVSQSSLPTPLTGMTTNTLLSTGLPSSTSDNQYGEDDLSPSCSSSSSSTFGAISYEQPMQERQQAPPAPAAHNFACKRTTNNNNNNNSNNKNRPKSRTVSSCQCTTGLRNLLASLKHPGHVSSSSSSPGSQIPHSSEQQPYPIDAVLSNVAWALAQWATLATCPRCFSSEEQQVEEVFLLAVMSVRCVLGQLRGAFPSLPPSSSPVLVAREADTTVRRNSTTRSDGGGDTRKRRRRGESLPSLPISDELHDGDQQQYDDAAATRTPRVRVGSFDVTGPDRAMVLGMLRTMTARKMEGAVVAMRETLRGKMQEDTNDDGTGSGSLLAHIDIMFEDLALAIRTLQ